MAVGALAVTATACAGLVPGARQAGAAPSFQATWSRQFPGVVALSSPIVARIGSVPAVVVGDRNGVVHAVDLATGADLPGWPVTTPGGKPVDSTPSTLGSTVFVGVGDADQTDGRMLGGYLALAGNGRTEWYRQLPLTPSGGLPWGVRAGLTVGELQGAPSVVAGTMGQDMGAYRVSGGARLAGFPWLSSDSEFSTPALADLYGTGHEEIISGAAQTAGHYGNHVYTEGGHLRILPDTGNKGTGSLIGGPRCDITPNEAVDSSPAVGPFLAGHATGIVVGTSNEMRGVSDEDAVFTIRPNCSTAWKVSLDGPTLSSPALVDALGNGDLQVAEGTMAGGVYLLDGASGRTLWHRDLPGAVIGSVTSVDLGGGYQDILAPTTTGLYVLDGRTGQELARLDVDGVGLQNSVLVTDDPDGRIGLTVAGYNMAGGAIVHYEIPGTNGALADEAGSWPMFHHDPQLTGSVLPTAAANAGVAALRGGQRLAPGRSLVNPAAGAQLTMRRNGDLVLSRDGLMLWQTHTAGHPGASAVLQGDGNLVVRTKGGRALWASRTAGHAGDRLVLQDDANLAIYQGGRALWATGT